MSTSRDYIGGRWIEDGGRYFWTGSKWVPYADHSDAEVPPVTGVPALIEAALNPANYSNVITVGSSGILTIRAAVTAAFAVGGTAPVLIMVPPGSYTESVALPAGASRLVDIRSTTLNPADVLIDPGTGATDDALDNTGSPGIIAGVTLVGRNGFSGIHSGLPANTNIASPDFIYYKVSARQVGSNNAFSWGLGSNFAVYAYDCTFEGDVSNGANGTPAVYAHTFDGAAAKTRLVFDNVRLSGVTAGGLVAGIVDWNSGRADEVWMRNVTTAGGSIGFSYKNGSPAVGTLTGTVQAGIPVTIPAEMAVTSGTLPAEYIPRRFGGA